MKIPINTLDDLIKAFNPLLIENRCFFRGVSDKKQLLPKILRDGNFAENEFEILKEFEQHYGAYSSTNVNSPWEFLALAQHYGLMTRLIDFTSNPFVALFFALHTKAHIGQKYSVYSINKELLNDLLASTSGLTLHPEDDVDSFLDGWNIGKCITDVEADQKYQFTDLFEVYLKQMSKKPGIFYLSPNYKNNRVLMQQGVFLIPKRLDENNIYSLYEENMDVYEIDENIRQEVLEYLDHAGYNEFKLMPDLNSLCYDINHRIKEK